MFSPILAAKTCHYAQPVVADVCLLFGPGQPLGGHDQNGRDLRTSEQSKLNGRSKVGRR